jgi:hypothetical protein
VACLPSRRRRSHLTNSLSLQVVSDELAAALDWAEADAVFVTWSDEPSASTARRLEDTEVACYVVGQAVGTTAQWCCDMLNAGAASIMGGGSSAAFADEDACNGSCYDSSVSILGMASTMFGSDYTTPFTDACIPYQATVTGAPTATPTEPPTQSPTMAPTMAPTEVGETPSPTPGDTTM